MNKFTFLRFCALYLRMDKDDHLHEAATYVGGPRFKSGTGYNKKSYFAASVSTAVSSRGSDVTTVFLLIFA